MLGESITIVVLGTMSGVGGFGTGTSPFGTGRDGIGGDTPSVSILESAAYRGHIVSFAQ